MKIIQSLQQTAAAVVVTRSLLSLSAAAAAELCRSSYRGRWSRMVNNVRPLDVRHFRSAVDAHARDWGVTDGMLYELCRNHPGHDGLSAVNAKSLLIGRSFATGIERHIKSSGSQGSSIGQLAAHLQRNSSLVDGIINRLKGFQEPLDLQILSVVVSEHGKFCNLLVQISRDGNVPASFASKYLHFHCPVVPIYDRWAYDQAWRRRKREGLGAFEKPADAHDDYYWYSLCFWQHYSDVRALVPATTVRMAEFYLLWLAGESELQPSDL